MATQNQAGQPSDARPEEPQHDAAPGEREARSFAEPGHTSPQGEGGGAMSGRGQEEPGSPRGGGEAPVSSASGATAGPGGLASALQPGGTIPGGGPGASQGSLGTGGGSTAGSPSGSLKRGGG
jgi:hypothetical protein